MEIQSPEILTKRRIKESDEVFVSILNDKEIMFEFIKDGVCECCISEIQGVHSFIYEKRKEYGFDENEPRYRFLQQPYLVVQHGIALSGYLVGFYQTGVDPLQIVKIKLTETDYEDFDVALQTHRNSIKFMAESAILCDVSETPYIKVIGEREVVDGKTYHEEGMLSRKITPTGTVTDLFGGDDAIIEVDAIKHYTIKEASERYVCSNGNFSMKKIYRLKETNKIAVESSVFAVSDIYMVSPVEIEFY